MVTSEGAFRSFWSWRLVSTNWKQCQSRMCAYYWTIIIIVYCTMNKMMRDMSERWRGWRTSGCVMTIIGCAISFCMQAANWTQLGHSNKKCIQQTAYKSVSPERVHITRTAIAYYNVVLRARCNLSTARVTTGTIKKTHTIAYNRILKLSTAAHPFVKSNSLFLILSKRQHITVIIQKP